MTNAIEALAQDLRYAARGLRNTPGFTLTAVLTLTIGIGATTAVFSVINGVLLRPLPYADANRLVAVSNIFRGSSNEFGPVSGTDVSHWRVDNQVFEQLEFVSHPDIVAMSSAGTGERVAVQHLTAQLLPMLGINAFMGSIPSDDITERRGSLGVLISYEFWQHHFACNPKILGQRIFVDTWPSTVIAVLEPGFDLFGTGVPEIYEIDGLPDVSEPGIKDVRWVDGVGKLKRGVSAEQAQATMKVRQLHLAEVFPETYKDVGIRVDPLQKRLFGNWANIYYTMFGVVALVLLIACANVANLLLVRGDGRRREVGVRVALGANRGTLIRQLLTESVLLSLIGGLAGVVLGFFGVKVFNLWVPVWFPRETGTILDSRVLLFTFSTCVLTGIAFGLIPAYRAVRTNLTESLQSGGRSTATVSRHRTRNTLVVTEIALAFILLICAGLMINTLTRILRTSPGFAPEQLLTAQVRLTGDKYIGAYPKDPDFNLILPPVAQFCDRVLDRFRNTPGVEDVALIDWFPLLDGNGDSAQYASPGFTIVGQNAPSAAERPNVFREGVTAGYFPLMRIPIVRGRGVSEQDTASNAWVVVINEAMAKRYWPNQDPVGQAIKFDDSPDEKPRQIVGIVQDVKQFALTEPAVPEAFVPYQQLSSRIYPGWTEARVHKSIIVRTHADPTELMQRMRRIIVDLAPESAIFGFTTVERTVLQSATPWRFLSEVLELFAGIALLLAVIGIYGVISYSIGERRHELGLRMALGAQRGQVLGLVLRQAIVLSLIGLTIGVAGSFAATPLLANFLYGVNAHDLLTLILVSSLLMAVTAAASYIPARRATKIDPMQALRHE